MRVCSFDVFDTLLMRVFARPSDLFLELGLELAQERAGELNAISFAVQRVFAEERARGETVHGEPTIREIYDVLARQLEWSEAVRDLAMHAEMELEERSIVAVPGMPAQVADARRRYDRIAFLSDMYLPASFIESLLEKHAYFRPGDLLLVSGETRMSKVRGGMFDEVRRRIPNITDWVHVGDHEYADGKVPRGRGIRCELRAGARLNRYEMLAVGEPLSAARAGDSGGGHMVCPEISPAKASASECPQGVAWEGGGTLPPQPAFAGNRLAWRSRLGGAMRRARLAVAVGSNSRHEIGLVGCSVAGPLLFGFVQWCLEQANARGLKRIYFVARDGQILHRIALRLVERWGYGVECRYLYGSRQAWNGAAIKRLEASQLGWLMPPTRFLSVEQVFGRVGVEPELFKSLLESAGFSREQWSANLTEGERSALRGVLNDSSLGDAVAASAAAQRSAVIEYLDQEGWWDTPCAMVDIGWHGNLQRSLATILRLSGRGMNTPLTGFYFGLFRPPDPDEGQAMLAYWNLMQDGLYELCNHNTAMFEIFTSADHGSTVRYARTDDGIVAPVLDRPTNDQALGWGLREFQAGVMQFVEAWLESVGRGAYDLRDFRPLTRTLYRQFYYRPTRSESIAWGGYPFSDQQIERTYDRLIPDWSWWQTCQAIWDYRKRPGCWWPEGMLATRRCWPLALFLVAKRWKWAFRRGLGDGVGK